MTGAEIAAAAETLVGIPFRLHGRTPETGLDCIGVVEAALTRAGRSIRLPNGYPLRCSSLPDLSAITEILGLHHAVGPIMRGDVLMLQPSPCQFHLAIAACPATIVHAHAGLRKVVRGALPAGWPHIGHWRLTPR